MGLQLATALLPEVVQVVSGAAGSVHGLSKGDKVRKKLEQLCQKLQKAAPEHTQLQLMSGAGLAPWLAVSVLVRVSQWCGALRAAAVFTTTGVGVRRIIEALQARSAVVPAEGFSMAGAWSHLVALYGSRGGPRASKAAVGDMFDAAWGLIREQALTACPTASAVLRAQGDEWTATLEEWSSGSHGVAPTGRMTSTRVLLFPGLGLLRSSPGQEVAGSGVLGQMALTMTQAAEDWPPPAVCPWELFLPVPSRS